MRYLFALVALTSAPLLALQAAVNSGGEAPDWAIERSGFRSAESVLERAETQLLDPRPGVSVADELVSAATRAYAKEPLSTDALYVIAGGANTDPEDVWEHARALDRRHVKTSLALLDSRARQGDLEAMGPLLDELGRLRPQLASEFGKSLAASIEDEATAVWLGSALRHDPSWSRSFWRSPPDTPGALDRFFSLRMQQVQGSDYHGNAALLRKLLANERFDDAFAFYRALRSIERGGSAERDTYPPLDWQVDKGRDANARETAPGTWKLFVNDGTAGRLAQRLVKLSPGELRLEGRLSQLRGRGTLEVELTCAGRDGHDFGTQSFDGEAVWIVKEKTCDYGWLRLRGSAWESSIPFEATLRDLQLYRS
ncbi:hypothetical protein [Sphingomicrobium astaxanthinifaciens]|uniref:hypothetical protein n=1 Tax=Sphingomicrobium astaxanthinifaciens TaxID=1227949 RepID=UPI001FCB8169|nr:hypothetical protein [Sphingomicrobium astaxanthinifaciens]MCJ7420421.1 hypothetical protein [Sphingomicrobium astaxanthinifaciens]